MKQILFAVSMLVLPSAFASASEPLPPYELHNCGGVLNSPELQNRWISILHRVRTLNDAQATAMAREIGISLSNNQATIQEKLLGEVAEKSDCGSEITRTDRVTMFEAALARIEPK